MTNALDSKFWLICVPTRLGLAALSGIYPNPMLWGSYAAVSAAGNLVQTFRYNENQTGVFGQKTWWNRNRHINIFLMVFMIIIAFLSPDVMWIMMVASVFFGVMSRIVHKRRTKQQKNET